MHMSFPQTCKAGLLKAIETMEAIGGSGNSPNVQRALEYANAIGFRKFALSGRDGGNPA